MQKIRGKKDFHFLILDFSGKMIPVKNSKMTLVSCPYPYKGYIWFENKCRNSKKGIQFESNVIKKLKDFFKKEESCL